MLCLANVIASGVSESFQARMMDLRFHAHGVRHLEEGPCYMSRGSSESIS